MARRFKDMPTPEQAHALREEARAAEAEIHELTTPRRRESSGGRVTPEFGPHSDRTQARVDQLQATARDLRAAADSAEQPKSKPKRRWFR